MCVDQLFGKGRRFFLLFLAAYLGCGDQIVVGSQQKQMVECDSGDGIRSAGLGTGRAGVGALLATRFSTLEELKTVLQIEYSARDGRPLSSGQKSNSVHVSHCSNGQFVTSILDSGISQDDISNAQAGSFWEKAHLGFNSPYAIRNRTKLQCVLLLARRVPLKYGEGDPAFFDLALASVANINTQDLAFRYSKDTTEKGYLNTFNHITAQAFITSIFDEDLADFVADVHERKNMPELISGEFTSAQLLDPIDNPVDNYVDMINNEWGQELGLRLKKKYNIDAATNWNSLNLTNYLNDIQAYYGWAFQIGFEPFRPENDLVIRFAKKLNVVVQNGIE
jgi:hypothetical protein